MDAATGYRSFRIADGIRLIQEPGVANFMRCNIWHVEGRDFDLVIDTGMGLNPLRPYLARHTDRPVKALVTHCHFDHSGGLHEFGCRLGHPAEADILARPANAQVVYSGDWLKIGIVDPHRHPDYSPEAFRITPAPLTGYLDEGDVIDLGDRAFRVLHLPGHSPGSIALWDVKARVLFTGDVLYDGELLDNLYHSDPALYRLSLERLMQIDAEAFHAGHFPSFGQERMRALARAYLDGKNRITNVLDWYAREAARGGDMFADQDWSGVRGV
jgi:glyoxylase-like metal-dependent hydrolase (beta-lactamase superfamily II)